MYKPGDIIGFYSDDAGKHKYHICVSYDGDFLFLNTPRKRRKGNLYVPCSRVPGIEPTDCGESEISCTLVIRKTDSELRSSKSKWRGESKADLLQEIFDFVEDNEAISENDRKRIAGGLADYL